MAIVRHDSETTFNFALKYNYNFDLKYNCQHLYAIGRIHFNKVFLKRFE